MASTHTADWIIRPRNTQIEHRLVQELGVSPILAAILAGRGMAETSAAKRFLSPSLDDLHDPFLLPDLDRAADRILRALEDKEPFLVHGDYDADGITASALLVRFLGKLGAEVQYFLPHRFEDSYGLSERAVRACADSVGLIIAVDCGVRDHVAVACARGQEQDVIIVDHHEPGTDLPDGALVIDPKRKDSEYPERELAAVGLAFKLASGICHRMDLSQRSLQRAFLDLVAIGTITDVCPLVGENRLLTSAGLQLLPHTRKLGLQVLLELCDLGDNISAQDVAFRLGPRLNAVGRMADATDALDLLLTDDEMEARRTALHLDSLNSQRRSKQATILREALAMVEEDIDAERDRVVVLSRQGWHRGVLGIVASNVLEATGLPALLMEIEGNVARGSARSVPGFDIAEALDRCDDLLERHGGHSMAAGFQLHVDRIDPLRQRLNEVACEIMSDEALRATRYVDAEVDLAEVDRELAMQLGRMQPCGEENPEPLLAARDVSVVRAQTVGAEGKHLKLQVRSGTKQIDCIGFGLGDKLSYARSGSRVDLCFVPMLDDYTGVERLQLQVADLRPALV